MALWRSGLTHMPLTHTFAGSNPTRVTKLAENALFVGFLSDYSLFSNRVENVFSNSSD